MRAPEIRHLGWYPPIPIVDPGLLFRERVLGGVWESFGSSFGSHYVSFLRSESMFFLLLLKKPIPILAPCSTTFFSLQREV